jgi:hypothetical protein
VRRTLLSAVVLVLPLAACASRADPISPEPPRSFEVEQAPAPAPRAGGSEVSLPATPNGVLPPGAADKVLAQGAAPIVKVLESGAEPRNDLSYTLTKGTLPKLAMVTDMAVTITSKGQSLPQMPMPRMTLTFDINAADKNAAGEFKIESRLSATSVDPNGGQQEQMARALRPQIEAMKGLGMTYWVSPKGHIHDVKLDIPQSVPPAAQQIMGGMSQSFESMMTPLPADPVGVGARWQVINRMTSGGADLLQSAIYTLKARSGPSATVGIALTRLAASDTIHTAQMPAGMNAKVKSFSSSSSGTMKLDMKSVAPEGGSMAEKTVMTIAVQGAGANPGDESTVETTTTQQFTRP